MVHLMTSMVVTMVELMTSMVEIAMPMAAMAYNGLRAIFFAVPKKYPFVNKLASLEAKLVRNYDRLTHSQG